MCRAARSLPSRVPGNIVLEINTRRATTRAARQADLAEALAFTRLHLAAADPDFAGPPRKRVAAKMSATPFRRLPSRTTKRQPRHPGDDSGGRRNRVRGEGLRRGFRTRNRQGSWRRPRAHLPLLPVEGRCPARLAGCSVRPPRGHLGADPGGPGRSGRPHRHAVLGDLGRGGQPDQARRHGARLDEQSRRPGPPAQRLGGNDPAP